MIINLQPIEVLFDKVIGDSGLPPHEVRIDLWRRWCAEAMGHIGGQSRVPYVKTWDQEALDANGYMSMPQSILILNILDLRYYLDENAFNTNRKSYKTCVPAPDKILDNNASDIQFVIGYRNEGVRRVERLRFNRTSGYIDMLSEKSLVSNGTYNLLVPMLDSYMEALYWYIMMKTHYREMEQGKQGKDKLHQYAAGMFNNMKQYAYGELMMPDQWELKELADEMSLGICYTSLRRRHPDQFGWWKYDTLQTPPRYSTDKPVVYPPDYTAPWNR